MGLIWALGKEPWGAHEMIQGAGVSSDIGAVATSSAPWRGGKLGDRFEEVQGTE